MKMYWHKEGYHSNIRPMDKSSIIAGAIIVIAVFQPIFSISTLWGTAIGLTPYELTKMVLNKNPEISKSNVMNISILFLATLFGSIALFFLKGFGILPTKLNMAGSLLAIATTIIGFIFVTEIAASKGGFPNVWAGGTAVYLPIVAVIVYFYLER